MPLQRPTQKTAYNPHHALLPARPARHQKPSAPRPKRLLTPPPHSAAAKLPPEEIAAARHTLANYRSLHINPMQSMAANFKNKAIAADPKAIIVRRLKRMPSILAKLRREPSMQITTMGDIGGIRIIARDLATTRAISAAIRRAKTKNELLAINDYLSHPKATGYRSIHHLYAYRGASAEHAGCRIELQIRSQIQHAWATAVEVADTFNADHLKAGEGNPQWQEFFRLAGIAFADIENGYTDINANSAHRRRLRAIAHKFHGILSTYEVVIQIAPTKAGYHVIQLDTRIQKLRGQSFPPENLQQALDSYRDLESQTKDIPHINVLMTSADSVRNLKKAYPNYFADSRLFRTTLAKAIGKNTPT